MDFKRQERLTQNLRRTWDAYQKALGEYNEFSFQPTTGGNGIVQKTKAQAKSKGRLGTQARIQKMKRSAAKATQASGEILDASSQTNTASTEPRGAVAKVVEFIRNHDGPVKLQEISQELNIKGGYAHALVAKAKQFGVKSSGRGLYTI